MDDLSRVAHEMLDSVRYVALGTVDADGCPRVSPVYFVHRDYTVLYWVAHPETHHSATLWRDPRVSGVALDSTVPPGPLVSAVYVVGRAREIPPDQLPAHLPHAFDPSRGGRSFSAAELTGNADLRLWVMQVEQCEVHVGAGHPTLGTGRDRRVPVSL